MQTFEHFGVLGFLVGTFVHFGYLKCVYWRVLLGIHPVCVFTEASRRIVASHKVAVAHCSRL